MTAVRLSWFLRPDAMMRRAYAVGVAVGIVSVWLAYPLLRWVGWL